MASFGVTVMASQEVGTTICDVLTLIARYITVHYSDGSKFKAVPDRGSDGKSYTFSQILHSRNEDLPDEFLSLEGATKVTVHLQEDIVTADNGSRHFVIEMDADNDSYEDFSCELENTQLAYFVNGKVHPYIRMGGGWSGDYKIVPCIEPLVEHEVQIEPESLVDLVGWAKYLVIARRLVNPCIVLSRNQ